MLDKYLKIIYSEKTPKELRGFTFTKPLLINEGDLINVSVDGLSRIYKVTKVDGKSYRLKKLPGQEKVNIIDLEYD
ncbi:MAG: hypothetical protein WC998_08455 [Candidatus Paceibacterota bacterium]|jgi:hypothetical protein